MEVIKNLLLIIVILLFSFQTSAEEKYQVGQILPLSGAYQEYAKECLEGFKLADQEASNELKAKVDFLLEDDQSNPKGTVNAFHKLLRNKNLLLVSAFSSSNALAINSLSVKNHISVLGLSGHPDFLKNNPYAISNWQETEVEAKAFFNWLVKNNVKTLGIVTFENDYTLALRTFIKQWSQESGIRIIFDELVYDQSDYRSILAKVRKDPPETFFINLLGSTFAGFTRQLAEAGYHGPKLSVNANSRSEYLQSAGIAASDGTIFFGPNYQHDYFLNHFPKDRDVSQGMTYVFSCYTGQKLVIQEIEELIKANKLSKENLQERIVKANQVIFQDHIMKVKDRRLQYDFIMSQAKAGKIVHSNASDD